jgi:hypothetical protein
MGRRTYTPEQVINKLPEAEILLNQAVYFISVAIPSEIRQIYNSGCQWISLP